MKLDLGCGAAPAPGYEGVDIRPGPGVVQVADLFARPWPWLDDSVEAVHCSHFVEHVPDLIGFMEELWRVCKDGAEAVIVHPYQFSVRAWQDPTHVRALNEVSWAYYSAEGRRGLNVEHYGIKADFEVYSIEFLLAPEWDTARVEAVKNGKPLDLARAVRNGVNVVDDLRVTLRARK